MNIKHLDIKNFLFKKFFVFAADYNIFIKNVQNILYSKIFTPIFLCQIAIAKLSSSVYPSQLHPLVGES